MASSILVTGDFVTDHHVYEGRKHYFADQSAGVVWKSELGGAGLIAEILRRRKPDDSQSPTVALAVDPAKTVHSAYAYWRPLPPNTPRNRQRWRVSEAMGFGDQPALPPPVDLPKSLDKPDVVVISDGGMGFRDTPKAWPDFSADDQWILLKTAAPIGKGGLWKRLSTEARQRLVLVVGAHDLRTMPGRMSEGLSWDETIHNFASELRSGFAPLTQCRYLVVTFDLEGGLWMDFSDTGAGSRINFIHDPAKTEGEIAVNTEGQVFGYQSCVAAAVARQLCAVRPSDASPPNFTAAIESAVSAMRDLLDTGHGFATTRPAGFPAERVAEILTNPPDVLARAAVHIPDLAQRSWSIVGSGIAADLTEPDGRRSAAYDLAKLLLLRGHIALASVPHLKLGDLVTPERQAIESLRSLIQIVRRYRRRDEAGKKPLSLAVFGPPGAGKSFAVKEIAKSVLKLKDGEGWLEFNLSQFNDSKDLIGAFHQVRDQVLQGRLPVAFFDEFDAGKYRWLASLLAPMQDGKFQDGQITHTLGKCVFVFAGGTSWTFNTFGPAQPEDNAMETIEWQAFRALKGPDFKSRIDGYLDVVGPNQRLVPVGAQAAELVTDRWIDSYRFALDPADVYFPIRRALMIRKELRCSDDDKPTIDEGLVHALLRTSRYTHGARSVGKVIQPFLSRSSKSLHRSQMLPLEQLDMHVDAADFIDLCNKAPVRHHAEDEFTPEQRLTIAAAIHETYNLHSGGTQKFENLGDHDTASNLAAADRMIDNLRLVELRLVPVSATQEEVPAIGDHLEYFLEALAEAEHEGWMKWHFARGWQYGKKKDPKALLHHCLVPYAALDKKDADKDRVQIRHYPEFARRAGLKIVRVTHDAHRD